MNLKNQQEWDELTESSDRDSYSKACINSARVALELLDDIPEDFNATELVLKADRGITGYMAGWIAWAISHHHIRGEEFKKKWNKENGIADTGDITGVVNPAVLNISSQ